MKKIASAFAMLVLLSASGLGHAGNDDGVKIRFSSSEAKGDAKTPKALTSKNTVDVKDTGKLGGTTVTSTAPSEHNH